jgi:hypothetical protein
LNQAEAAYSRLTILFTCLIIICQIGTVSLYLPRTPGFITIAINLATSITTSLGHLTVNPFNASALSTTDYPHHHNDYSLQTYTDPRTLVTHIYIRQLVNGLEIIDGDININVDETGRVISFGDSVSRLSLGFSGVFSGFKRARLIVFGLRIFACSFFSPELHRLCAAVIGRVP